MYKKIIYISLFLVYSISSIAQTTTTKETQSGEHYNINKFRQMHQEMATPNMFRTASGAPGPAYYQQQADYKMDIVLDDEKAQLFGTETITYYNNSPENLDYLWVQLDQNIRAADAVTPLKRSEKIDPIMGVEKFAKQYLEPAFSGGFHIEYVKDSKGNAIPYFINQTMMRIDLKEPLQSGKKVSFSIKWWYNINNYLVNRGRSGYEEFKDGNRLYVIAQFYPRMAVYNDVEGWQNMQFWGNGEFALPFGNFDVTITVPSDHILEATGELQNRNEVFTKEQLNRWKIAEETFDKPVVIVTQEEAEKAEKGFSKTNKKWHFKAQNVRDFGFSSSRKFILDAMAVQLETTKPMAISLYPKEANPLWGDYSTKVVAHTLKTYSHYTFDYPYPKAVSVSAAQQGMEYPMICWNYGRPDENGNYTNRTKYGMLGVIIHEIGHNYFPMIVNSDERQWTWMDEGLNTFLEYLTEKSFDPNFPLYRGPAANIVPYMKGNQNFIAPIMSNSENLYKFGSNAYAKPATGLNILRETIMGHELFDFAFKTYANRWKFKHPTPEDFFRTMEDASAVDLDWFWRGWFYSTEYVDLAIKNVNQYYVVATPTKEKEKELEKIKNNRWRRSTTGNYIFLIDKNNKELTPKVKRKFKTAQVQQLNDFLQENYTKQERSQLKTPHYFYEVTVEKIGGMIMPIIIQLQFEDGTTTTHKFPAQIWRKNNTTATRIFATDKKVTKFQLDPKLETADIDTENNSYPRETKPSKFDD